MKYRKQTDNGVVKLPAPPPAARVVLIKCPDVIHMLMQSLKQYNPNIYESVVTEYGDLLEDTPGCERRTQDAYEQLEDTLLGILIEESSFDKTAASSS